MIACLLSALLLAFVPPQIDRRHGLDFVIRSLVSFPAPFRSVSPRQNPFPLLSHRRRPQVLYFIFTPQSSPPHTHYPTPLGLLLRLGPGEARAAGPLPAQALGLAEAHLLHPLQVRLHLLLGHLWLSLWGVLGWRLAVVKGKVVGFCLGGGRADGRAGGGGRLVFITHHDDVLPLEVLDHVEALQRRDDVLHLYYFCLIVLGHLFAVGVWIDHHRCVVGCLDRSPQIYRR